MKRFACLFIFLLLCPLLASPAAAQQLSTTIKGELVRACVHKGDTIPYVKMKTLFVYPPYPIKNKKQRAQYDRLVRDVKRTLPIAKMIKLDVQETAKVLITIENKREKKTFMEEREKELKKKYTPMLKRLTLSQGKLLIRLIDRECDHTTYELVKMFMGSVKAMFYQTFAAMFGANLKKEFHPDKEDLLIERVINMVESGQL